MPFTVKIADEKTGDTLRIKYLIRTTTGWIGFWCYCKGYLKKILQQDVACY